MLRLFAAALLGICFIAPLLRAQTPAAPAAQAAPGDDAKAAQLKERDRLWDEAQKLYDEQKVDEAIGIARKMLAIEKQLLDADDGDLLFSIQWLANACEEAGLWKDGEAFRREAIEWTKKHRGADHWQTTDARLSLELHFLLSKLTEEQHEQLLEADALADEAAELRSAGEYAEALPKNDEAYAIYAKVLGSRNTLTSEKLGSRAWTRERSGDYAGAHRDYEELLKTCQAMLGEKHPDTAMARHLLGFVLYAEGKYPEARTMFETALKLRVELFGDDDLDVAHSRNNLALVVRDQGDYAEARRLFEAALKTYEAELGPDDPQVATTLNNIGYLLFLTADYAGAKSRIERALAIRQKAFGKQHLETTTAMNDLGLVLRAGGNFAGARRYLEEVCEIRKAVLGERHPHTLTALNNLALVLTDLADYAAARRQYEQILTIRREISGEMHPDYALALSNLAFVLNLMGEYATAKDYYEQSLKVRLELFGENHRDTAAAIDGMASCFSAMGDYEQALKLYRRSMAIRKQVFGEKHPEYALSLNNVGYLYSALGDYADAKACYEESLAIRKQMFGENHPSVAGTLNNLAAVHCSLGNFAAGLRLHEQALAIRKATVGENHPDFATSLNNLGVVSSWMGDAATARTYFERALAIRKQVQGEKHPDYAYALTNYGFFLVSINDYAAALEYYDQAREIRRATLGERHPDYALVLHSMGVLYYRSKEYAAAEPLLLQARDIYRQALGTRHSQYGVIINDLALLYADSGNFAAAEPLMKESIEIARTVFGENHPSFAVGENNLAYLYAKMGRYAEAEPHFRRALGLTRRLLEATALVQSERQQLAMAQELRYRLNNYVSLGVNSGAYARGVFSEVLTWKGATLVRQRGMRMAADDPLVAGLFAQLQQTARRLASLSRAAPNGDDNQASWHKQVADLTAEKERLEAELSDKSAAYRQAVKEVTLDDLLAALPQDAVLVDYLEYLHTPAPSENKPAQYRQRRLAAFVVRHAETPAGQVTLIDLGPAAAVGAAIDRWRKTFGMDAVGMAAGIELRRAVWEPVLRTMNDERGTMNDEPATKHEAPSTTNSPPVPLTAGPSPARGEGSRTILVSTDGVLGRLPLGALPGSKPDTYLLEEHRLAMLPVPQLLPALINDLGRRELKHQLLLLGDVDYDSSTAAEAAPRKRKQPSRPGERTRAPTESGLFSPLVNTAGEIATIKDLYAGLFEALPDDPLSLVKRTAGEARFRELAPQYRHLHLATHGFFAGAAFQSADDPEAAAQSALRQSMAPWQGAAAGRPIEVVGIGANMVIKEGRAEVTQLAAGAAAAADGRLQVGDVILKVGQAEGEMIDVAGKPLVDVVAMIRGPADTKVRLEVQPKAGGAPVVYELTRRTIPQPGAAGTRSADTRSAEPVAGGNDVVVGYNPGLLSGLALSGANEEPTGADDDGILTAQEIAVLNLSGVDTVVLSACDTGLGETAGGEGLLGVQRAFQVAGARTTVASFWKVDDLVTRLLMERFYRNLWEGEMSYLDALREAQLYVLNHPEALRGSDPQPDDPKLRTAPRLWAAFTLSGDWR